jgi:hypothetical protein
VGGVNELGIDELEPEAYAEASVAAPVVNVANFMVFAVIASNAT